MMPSTVSAAKQRAMAACQGLQLAGAGVLVPVVQHRVDRVGVGERGRDLGKPRGRDAMRHQPQPVGIGAADGAARQRQIHADLVRHAGEGPAHPVVGKQADAGLGHGKAVALAGDAVRAVERDADAGADHHPVDQRDGRLGEALELPVERIFGGQRLDAPPPCGCGPIRSVSRMSPPAQKARSEAEAITTA